MMPKLTFFGYFGCKTAVWALKQLLNVYLDGKLSCHILAPYEQIRANLRHLLPTFAVCYRRKKILVTF